MESYFFLLPLLQPHIGAATVLVDELDARHPNYVVAFSVAPIRVQIDILAKNNLLYSLDYFHFISQILQLTSVLFASSLPRKPLALLRRRRSFETKAPNLSIAEEADNFAFTS